MANELEGLAEPVRDAFVVFDRDLRDGSVFWHAWQLARAELLRLARENAELSQKVCRWIEEANECSRNWNRAESELAALRKRVGESPCVMEWRPIGSAPHKLKVLVGYKNSHGHWRNVTAIYYPDGTLPMEETADDGEDEFAPAGWYETSETHDFIYPTSAPPTHWMPLPRVPEATA